MPGLYFCECGAAGVPNVGIVRFRAKSPGGQFAVGCTRCGRVGQHGRTVKQAANNWASHQYAFGPARCPVCGSIDVSAAGVCLHCGTKIDEEDIYEKRKND